MSNTKPYSKSVLLLLGSGESSKIVLQYLKKSGYKVQAIVEQKPSRKKFIKRRIKRIGLGKVLGQIMFQLFVVKLLSIVSKPRIKDLLDQENIELEKSFNEVHRVTSINSHESKQLIQSMNPDIIVVNGTRIISKKVILERLSYQIHYSKI